MFKNSCLQKAVSFSLSQTFLLQKTLSSLLLLLSPNILEEYLAGSYCVRSATGHPYKLFLLPFRGGQRAPADKAGYYNSRMLGSIPVCMTSFSVFLASYSTSVPFFIYGKENRFLLLSAKYFDSRDEKGFM